jgi:hypothetical protein
MVEILETLLFGVIVALVIGMVGFLIWALVSNPMVLLALIGGLLIIFSLGWCVQNIDNFIDALTQSPALNKVQPENKGYGIPVLDGLERFENKYHMSTVKFMWYVYNEWMPHGMNNLDYLEWVAMANSLSSVTMNKKEKGI